MVAKKDRHIQFRKSSNMQLPVFNRFFLFVCFYDGDSIAKKFLKKTVVQIAQWFSPGECCYIDSALKSHCRSGPNTN